jgi:hypothetical protein
MLSPLCVTSDRFGWEGPGPPPWHSGDLRDIPELVSDARKKVLSFCSRIEPAILAKDILSQFQNLTPERFGELIALFVLNIIPEFLLEAGRSSAFDPIGIPSIWYWKRKKTQPPPTELGLRTSRVSSRFGRRQWEWPVTPDGLDPDGGGA